MKAGQSRPAYFICKGGTVMHQIIVKPFGQYKKLSRKKLTEFIEIICEVSKDDIISVEVDESDNGIKYTVTVRG